MKNRSLLGILMLVLVLPLCAFRDDGCDSTTPTADKQTTEQQRQIQNRGHEQVGIPNIVNFTELRRAKKIYELRDQSRVATYSYTYDMNGHLHKFCDSIGYPLPYATQYSNPERPAESWETHEQGNIALPQAEPNGLFMPSSADGTWVECINPKNPSQTGVVYVEPHVVTSPWPLGSD